MYEKNLFSVKEKRNSQRANNFYILREKGNLIHELQDVWKEMRYSQEQEAGRGCADLSKQEKGSSVLN